MNKKGQPQYMIFLIFVIGILVFMFGTGAITSLILKNTIKKIPIWFWIGLIFFILIGVGKKK